MTQTLLHARGLRTGLFTSPHLSSMRERICVDGEPLSAGAVRRGLPGDLQPYLELVDATPAVRLSFFEVLIAMAFAAFADAPVDVAVVEVGMGGTWDNTNVADGAVAVVTPISIDHAQYLGDTSPEIAADKAGIIKPGCRRGDRPAAGRGRAECCCAGPARSVPAWPGRASSSACSAASWPWAASGCLSAACSGSTTNCTCRCSARTRRATRPARLLRSRRSPARRLAGAAGGETGRRDGGHGGTRTWRHGRPGRGSRSMPGWSPGRSPAMSSPGRLEVVRRSPLVLVDAAHNPAGMAAAGRAARGVRVGEVIAVLAVSADKDVPGILGELEPVAAAVVATGNSSHRSMEPAKLADLALAVFGPDRVIVAPGSMTPSRSRSGSPMSGTPAGLAVLACRAARPSW